MHWRGLMLDVESTPYFEMMNPQHPEGGFVEIQKFVLYWKRRPITIKELGIEIRIDSFSGDGSQSWVRISSGLNKFVRDLTEKDTKSRWNWRDFSKRRATCRPRIENCWNIFQMKQANLAAEAKPKPTSNPPPSSSTEQIPIHRRNRIDIWASRAHAQGCSELSCFEEDDFIAQTRNSSSRRRWSNWILEIEGGIQIKFLKFCALVNSILDRPTSKKVEDERRDFSCVLTALG